METTEAETKRIKALIKRTDVQDPKEADMAELQEVFDRLPGWALKLRNPYDLALNGLIAQLTGRRGFSAAVFKQQHAALLAELGYAGAPVLERLLIESAALSWLQYTGTVWHHNELLSQGCDPEAEAVYQRRATAAQQRYLRAVETLARVRQLAGPAGAGF